MVLVFLSALFNWITLSILNRVASVKQMDSYQEVAYNISNSNRGYIFLISAAKFIFLSVTAAFSINYTANYLADLSLLGRADDIASGSMTSGQVYGVYFAWVIFVGCVIFFFYYRQSNSKQWNSMVWYAYIFGACFIIQFFVVLVTMISAVSQSGSPEKGNILYD